MRVLHIEDDADDAELVRLQFDSAGVTADITRVRTRAEMTAALSTARFDVVLSDYALPSFSGKAALELLRGVDGETPFILVSGAIGEEAAVEMVRAGVTDFVMKEKLARLVPAVERAVREAQTRRARRTAEARLRDAESRLRGTFDQTAVGMAHVAVDGTILEANHAVADLLGTTAAAMPGTNCREWFHDGEETLRFLEGAAHGNARSNVIERTAVRADGSEVPVRITATAISRSQSEVRYLALIVEDISARVQAEREVLRQMSLLYATIEATGDAIVAGALDGRITACNQRFVSMLQAAGTVEARSLEEVFAHLRTLVREPERVTAMAEELLARPGAEESGTLAMADGRILEWFSAPQMLDGTPAGRVWCFRDVTERNRLLEAIEESEVHFRSIIENLPDLVWTLDEEGRLLWISPNVTAILGYTPAEMYDGRSAQERIHPDDRERLEEMRRALLAGGPPIDTLHRVSRKDGEWRWLRSRVFRIYERGGTRRTDGISTDVTEAVAAEQKIVQLARDRDLLLSSTVEGIIGIDTEGHCTFANRAASEILRLPPEAMIGARADDLFHRHGEGVGGPSGECMIADVVTCGGRCRVTGDTFWRADGSQVLVDYVAAPMTDRGTPRGIVLVFSDVTEIRATERKLEQANRIAGLGRVASTIAHEFNNVLMGILPFAEIVRRGAGGDPKLVNAADRILHSVNRGKRVAEEILRFTRSAKPTLVSTDVRNAMAGLEPELRAILPPTCRLDMSLPDEPVIVQVDWYQIEQVLTNLVTNARDAIGAEGSVAIRLYRADDGVHIDCSDDGHGIAEADLPKIFEPMFTTKRNGTGLGLAIARQVITSHGGTIDAESRQGQGTTFRIVLPG